MRILQARTSGPAAGPAGTPTRKPSPARVSSAPQPAAARPEPAAPELDERPGRAASLGHSFGRVAVEPPAPVRQPPPIQGIFGLEAPGAAKKAIRFAGNAATIATGIVSPFSSIAAGVLGATAGTLLGLPSLFGTKEANQQGRDVEALKAAVGRRPEPPAEGEIAIPMDQEPDNSIFGLLGTRDQENLPRSGALGDIQTLEEGLAQQQQGLLQQQQGLVLQQGEINALDRRVAVVEAAVEDLGQDLDDFEPNLGSLFDDL